MLLQALYFYKQMSDIKWFADVSTKR